MRDGGFQDTGAKDISNRVVRHICNSKDPSLFQIPEILAFHVGNAKKSEDKKRKIAIDHEESKICSITILKKKKLKVQSRF